MRTATSRAESNPEKELQLRTLRNQAILAIKQGG
jgi:hypothetical protein